MPDTEQFGWFFREMAGSSAFHVRMAVGVGSLVALLVILAAWRRHKPALATAVTWLWAGGTVAALYLFPVIAESPRREMVAVGVVVVAAGLLSAVWRKRTGPVG